jgi:pheromone shutdown-related protein TraB
MVEGKQIVLVGTAHISKQSIELVEKTIEKEKPDVIAVELDRQRFEQLAREKQWQEMDLAKIMKEGKSYLFLLNLLLANFQRKIGDQIGVKPGMEMMQAIGIAKKKEIPIVLVDRDVRVTLKRALNQMSLIEKLKLGTTLLLGFFQGDTDEINEEKIEELKQKDVLNALMQQLAEEMPKIKNVLVDERDLFIANQILNANAKKIVAVLGAGHLEGVKKFLDRRRNISHLKTIPKKRSVLRYLKFVVPLLFVLIIGYGFYAKGPEIALNLFFWWFLINGVLAAAGAAIARAHPFSVLAAFVAAPFTSLHPALAAGWFAGAMELKMRNPKVKDFEKLRELNGYRAFEKNRVTRILLVTVYANIGSTIGTVIALPYILTLLT